MTVFSVIADRPPSRRAVQLLAPTPSASADARAFVQRVCAAWGVLQYTEDALMVATELVENALGHTQSAPQLRLELRHGKFTVAVADDDPRPAVLHERRTRTEPGLGLWPVVRAARRWGSARSWSGGKAGWAVLVRRDHQEDPPAAVRPAPHPDPLSQLHSTTQLPTAAVEPSPDCR